MMVDTDDVTRPSFIDLKKKMPPYNDVIGFFENPNKFVNHE